MVRDVVIGMSDGLTVPFALAAGLSGAVASAHIVVTAGLAEVAAGSRTTWEIERAGGEAGAQTQLDCARVFVPMAYRRARRSIRGLTKNQDARLSSLAQGALEKGDLGPDAPTDI